MYFSKQSCPRYLGVYPGSASGPGWSRSSPVWAALALCLCAFWTSSSCVGRCWTAARRRRTRPRAGSSSSERWGPVPSSPPWAARTPRRRCAAGTGGSGSPGRGCRFCQSPIWPVRQGFRGWRIPGPRRRRCLRERATAEANSALTVLVFWGSDSWRSRWVTVVSVRGHKNKILVIHYLLKSALMYGYFESTLTNLLNVTVFP